MIEVTHSGAPKFVRYVGSADFARKPNVFKFQSKIKPKSKKK